MGRVRAFQIGRGSGGAGDLRQAAPWEGVTGGVGKGGLKQQRRAPRMLLVWPSHMGGYDSPCSALHLVPSPAEPLLGGRLRVETGDRYRT